MKKTFLFLIALVLILQPNAWCEIKSIPVEYKQGDTVLEGFLAYDDAQAAQKRPGVIIVHEWKGLNEYAKTRARKLAELGYVAFAADIYGKGVRPATGEEAGKIAGVYKNDRELTRKRAKAALDYLSQDEHVDSFKIAAIGYCFGGMVVLEMARAGFPLSGVVTFHGSLSPKLPPAGAVKSKLLVLHGALDPFVKPEEVAQFKAEMKKANADMRFISYEGAVHSFTNPESGDDPTKGVAYNAKADEASWEEMKKFFSEIFHS